MMRRDLYRIKNAPFSAAVFAVNTEMLAQQQTIKNAPEGASHSQNMPEAAKEGPCLTDAAR
jgi:hypothetical protein